jgi:DNA-directed RNA polymerase
MVAIHDSFGTHPSDVDQMHKFIREAFVELYTEYDPLVMFLEGIHQDVELPPRGNFELSHIMESEFFFC